MNQFTEFVFWFVKTVAYNMFVQNSLFQFPMYVFWFGVLAGISTALSVTIWFTKRASRQEAEEIVAAERAAQAAEAAARAERAAARQQRHAEVQAKKQKEREVKDLADQLVQRRNGRVLHQQQHPARTERQRKRRFRRRRHDN